MQTDYLAAWGRFQKYYFEFPEIKLALDLSRMSLADSFFDEMRPRVRKAIEAMRALEGGTIANPDEGRMVGHYWLRNPALAPTEEIRQQIEKMVADVKEFAKQVHRGTARGTAGKFRHLLLIGIGGSALGPQLVSNALSMPGKDKLSISFFDNTDPDGMDRVLAGLGRRLNRTLVLVISKSGGTKETRNGMLEAKRAFEAAGLSFAQHAVAVTGEGSELDQLAAKDGWLRRFPMWDWVGGRTSQLSAVGLLPAALQGFKISNLLAGAKACDRLTRRTKLEENPAVLLALAWHHSGGGNGLKDMVILPYKDRLELLSRYLQQLIMESLGKELDLQGAVVNQGIAVYGNKGSTDQHAYVQQLRDGLNNFFVTFIEVLKDRQSSDHFEVEHGVTSGDYLHGFFIGTRAALAEKSRESVTITVDDSTATTLGVLIALYERAVGIYAQLIGVNAYHQPGVEAGKKAATAAISLKLLIVKCLNENKGQFFSVPQLAKIVKAPNMVESVYKLCRHLSANGRIEQRLEKAAKPYEALFGCSK
jgi:glucose-6-phosphate isomerase